MQIKDITLLGDRIIIKPAKFFEYETKEFVKDTEANKGKDPDKDEMVMKEVTNIVRSNIQKATVVAVGDLVKGINIDDTVLYNMRACAQFELIKGYGILKSYDVVGIVNK